jgi:hypothetical protein
MKLVKMFSQFKYDLTRIVVFYKKELELDQGQLLIVLEFIKHFDHSVKVDLGKVYDYFRSVEQKDQISRLLHKGILELVEDDVSKAKYLSVEPLFNKIDILDEAKLPDDLDQFLIFTVNLFRDLANREITSYETEMINSWYYEQKIPHQKIVDAMNESAKTGHFSISAVNKSLGVRQPEDSKEATPEQEKQIEYILQLGKKIKK